MSLWICIWIYNIYLFIYLSICEGHSIYEGNIFLKSNFFSDFFSINSEFFKNWFITKIILISENYLIWGYSKWRQIKQSHARLEQRFMISFLAAKKCKLYEFFRRINDVKPVKLRLRNDLVSYPARVEGLVNMNKWCLRRSVFYSKLPGFNTKDSKNGTWCYLA